MVDENKEEKKKKQSPEHKGEYRNELMKFINQEVVVESYLSDGRLLETTGKLKGLNFQYMTCIVMTEEEKIIVKLFHRIRRKRDYNAKK